MRAALVLVGLLSLSSGTIKQADQVFQGTSPTASGQVACATAADKATWQAPTSCSLVTPASNYWTVGTYLTPQNITTPENVEIPATGSSTAAPTIMGFDMPTSGQAVQLQMGDANVGLWNAYAKRMMLVSYHGVELHGATGGAAQSYVAGAGTADPALTVFSGGGGGALRLDATKGGNALTVASGLSSVQALTAAGNFTATAGTNTYTGTVSTNSLNVGSGGAITFSGATTKAVSAVSCTASTCTSLGTATITGAAVTGVCMVSHTTTAGAIGTNGTSLNLVCGVTAANTVTLYCCNRTTGALSLTGTYAMRVIQ